MPPKRAASYAKRRTSVKRRRPYGRTNRISRARPMRALKNNYRSQNVYRFVRETLPTTESFTLISKGIGSYEAMGYLAYANLQFAHLCEPGDFTGLFARYKVDKIQTTLTPMFDNVPADSTTYNFSYNLELTRVNTKWINDAFTIAGNAEDQLNELAQMQGKSKSLYASKSPIRLTTVNPGVADKSVLDSAGNEIQVRGPMPWLSLDDQTSVPLKHNAIIFASRIDGGALDTNWKFRVTHKVWFRCSQVG